MMKRLMCILFAIALLFTTVGCRGGEDKDPDEATKTVLEVYNMDGGVGTDWLYAVAEKFENTYKDTEFEPGSGKKGVKVKISKGKDDMLSSLNSQKYNVVFTENVMYNDLISQKSILDITDIVAEETLEDVSGGKEKGKIADKLTAEQVSAFTALDGKHYVLPHFEVYAGISYDADLFAAPENSFYISKTGGWTSEKSEKSVGPNGIAGDYDDGLPSSMEEFYQLMDRMGSRGVKAFIWSGEYSSYVNRLLVGIQASLSGKDEYMLKFTYGNKSSANSAKIITGFNSAGVPQTETRDITLQTGYLTEQLESKYYALEMLSKILSSEKYYSTKISGVLSHLGAQEEYIYSNLDKEEPVAMLIEGSYWYNEAKDAFKRSENEYKEEAKNRNFAWMPLPVQVSGSVKEGEGRRNTLVESNSSFALINSNIKDNENLVKLAKLFLKFCYTDENLNLFTQYTGLPKGVKYQLTETTRKALNNYSSSLFALRENSDIIYPYADNKIFIYNQSMLFDTWGSNVKGTPYVNPYTAFKTDKVKANDYFSGGFISAEAWESANGDYFND